MVAHQVSDHIGAKGAFLHRTSRQADDTDDVGCGAAVMLEDLAELMTGRHAPRS